MTTFAEIHAARIRHADLPGVARPMTDDKRYAERDSTARGRVKSKMPDENSVKVRAAFMEPHVLRMSDYYAVTTTTETTRR